MPLSLDAFVDANRAMIPSNDSAARTLLTLAEVACTLRCSKAHASKLARGLVRDVPPLPVVRLGRRVVVRRDALTAWLLALDNSPEFG